MNTAAALQDLMTQYNNYRAKWIASNGTDAGFDAWFTKQVGV